MGDKNATGGQPLLTGEQLAAHEARIRAEQDRVGRELARRGLLDRPWEQIPEPARTTNGGRVAGLRVVGVRADGTREVLERYSACRRDRAERRAVRLLGRFEEYVRIDVEEV